MDIKIIGEHDERTIQQLRNCVEMGAVKGVLCADGHLGYAQPIGGVVAYDGYISPSGVGYDIACGNAAMRLPITKDDIAGRTEEIGREIAKRISFGVGRTNESAVEAECLDDDDAWQIDVIAGLKDLAAKQLGTVGSGNHYVDVFHDDEDRVWIGVHFGSRGLGHKSTTHFLQAAGGAANMDSPPTVLDLRSDLGEQYRAAMTLAGRYAYAGREWVVREVARILTGSTDGDRFVHNHHNYAFTETHDLGDGPREYFVVRKGATPAFPGQRSFVGGSMADKSVILVGKDTPEARENLYSTVHGAGRVLSRRQAAGKFKGWGKKRRQVEPGLIDPDEMRRKMDERGIVLVGAGADEAPECYRRLDDVLAHHADSVEVETVLHPMIVCMAGAGEFDPYKD